MVGKKKHKNKTSENSLITSGQLAEICGVNIKTVSRWADQGFIEVISLPGRGDRRFEVSNVVAFLKKNGMSLPKSLTRTVDGTPRILLVDDDENVIKSMVRVLSPLNSEIKTASDGFEAGFLLKDFQPHIIILDLMMPRCDGFEVIQLIDKMRDEKDFVAPRILVVSGKSPAELKRAVSLGADEYLSKPFESKSFLEKVDSLLN